MAFSEKEIKGTYLSKDSLLPLDLRIFQLAGRFLADGSMSKPKLGFSAIE